jgi:hypothetical protein
MASGEMSSEEFTAFLTSVFDRLAVHAKTRLSFPLSQPFFGIWGGYSCGIIPSAALTCLVERGVDRQTAADDIAKRLANADSLCCGAFFLGSSSVTFEDDAVGDIANSFELLELNELDPTARTKSNFNPCNTFPDLADLPEGSIGGVTLRSQNGVTDG